MRIDNKEHLNFVDVSEANLGNNVKIETPFYNAHMDKPLSLGSLLDKDLDTTHTGGITVNMPSLRETEAHMNVLGAGIHNRLKGKMILVDPRTEAMYFKLDEARDGFRKLSNIPTSMRDILRDAQSKNHDSVWSQNLNSPPAITKFAEFSVDTVSSIATIPLPITPFIGRKASASLIDLAFKINTEAHGIATRSYGKKTAGFYINMDAGIFEYAPRNAVYVYQKIEDAFRSLDDILLYVRINSSDKLTFSGTRNLMLFLNRVYRKRHENQDKNILIMTSGLNTSGLLAIDNGANGMDEVIDGKNSLSKGFGTVTKRHDPFYQFGKYYNSNDMEDEKYEVTRKFVEDNNVLPCTERVCGRVAPIFTSLNYRQYASFVRTHRMESRNREIREIKQDVAQANMRGLEDKFRRSRKSKIQEYAKLVV